MIESPRSHKTYRQSRPQEFVENNVSKHEVDTDAAQLRNLLRNLLNHLDQDPMTSPAEAAILLLDIELDGKRYQLVCDNPREDIQLSPREKQVAAYLIKGLSVKEIAYHLELGTSTVGTYVKRIYNKLNVSNRAEMVAALLHKGFNPYR